MSQASRTHRYHIDGLAVSVRAMSQPDGLIRAVFRCRVAAPDGRSAEGEVTAFYPFQAANEAARKFKAEGLL